MGCGTTTSRASPAGVVQPEVKPLGTNAPQSASAQQTTVGAQDAKAPTPAPVPPKPVCGGRSTRTDRFFESRSQYTYYTLEDSNTIRESLTIGVALEKYSIFFPIGVNAYKLADVLTAKHLDRIIEVAERDPLMGNHVEAIKTTVGNLKKSGVKQDTVIRSYTEDGLYNIFNQYIRYGHYTGIRLFREYLFCIKGSLIELGEPMTSKTTVYRGMRLEEKDLKRWENHVDQFALLSAFTSTSLNRETPERFMTQGGAGSFAVFISIELTDDIEQFNDYLSKFDFIEDCGVFYPTNIAKYSQYQSEEEVLFPPFYPFKVAKVVRASDGSRCDIKLIAPTRVCLSMSRIYWGKVRDFCGKVVQEEYTRKLCELVKRGLSDDLMFSIKHLRHTVRIGKKDIVTRKQLPEVMSAVNCKSLVKRFAFGKFCAVRMGRVRAWADRQRDPGYSGEPPEIPCRNCFASLFLYASPAVKLDRREDAEQRNCAVLYDPDCPVQVPDSAQSLYSVLCSNIIVADSSIDGKCMKLIAPALSRLESLKEFYISTRKVS